MPQFYVEGLFATRQGVKKKLKTGSYPASSIEPYAKSIWAESPRDAIRLATSELQGGEWTEQPKVSQVTEEERMRLLHQPEFPGLSAPRTKPQKR
jgi:hypothetical protein